MVLVNTFDRPRRRLSRIRRCGSDRDGCALHVNFNWSPGPGRQLGKAALTICSSSPSPRQILGDSELGSARA
jgi:hypothetical protein